MPTEEAGPLAELEEPWPDVVRHTVGRLSVDAATAGFRNLAVAGQVLVSALYPAVRAADWSTLDLGPAVDTLGESSGGSILTRDQSGLGRFHATTTLELSPDGLAVLRYELSPLGPEEVNRWGLNVCLDAQSWKGAAVRAGRAEHALPSDISPQRAVAGRPQGMFPAAAALRLVHPDGLLSISSTGLPLELEDQRNWTDPSYKIYSGSLQDQRPIRLEAGARYVQRLELAWQPARSRKRDVRAPRSVADEPARELPTIGVQLNELPADPRTDIADVLDDLGVDHVRLDVERVDAERTLSRLPLITVELAVLAAGDVEREAQQVADLAARAPAAVRVLWHLDGRRTTGAAETVVAERHLSDSIAVVPGTDAYFVDLNRDRRHPGPRVSFSISPTVHTDDSETVFATLAAQAEVVRQARLMFGAAVVVSPITWTIRGAPEASHDAAHRARERRADPRVRTLEAAAWTIGSVHALLSAEASSGTWHELYGTNGLIEAATAQADRGPIGWASTPTFHALAALQASTRPSARALRPPGSPWVGIQLVDRKVLVVASLRPWTQTLGIEELPGQVLSRRRLRPEDVAEARLTRRWWDAREELAADSPTVTLEPFEITRFGVAR